MNDFPRIRDLREDKDMTQEDMARELKISRRTYSHYETGERDIPSKVLIEIAIFHKTSVEYLANLTDDKSPNYTIDKNNAT